MGGRVKTRLIKFRGGERGERREEGRGCTYLGMDHGVEDGREEADAGPGIQVVVGGREGEEELEHASPVESPTDEGHAVPGTEGGGGGGGRGGGTGGGGEEVEVWVCGRETKEGREGRRVSE
jgi:hypothetical protein